MTGELPEKPTGWTRHLVVHLNYGGGRGSATYEIRNDKGEPTPIHFAYHTGKGKKREGAYRGFFVGEAGPFTWAELRAEWPHIEVKPR